MCVSLSPELLSIDVVFLPETLFSLSLTCVHSPDDGKMNIKRSFKDQLYDILDYFGLLRTFCGGGLLSTR